jgi:XapX domain-containing protein
MKPYLISLAMGLGVGLLYSPLGMRSPAPAAIALIGLLGIPIGEQAGAATRGWRRSATVSGTVPASAGKDPL